MLDHLRIVLVEPAGPLNVGAIARVMKNFGLRHWVLVNPQCDPNSSEARQMAVHGQELLAAVKIVETLPQALVGCQRAVATTARSRALSTPLETPESGLSWLLNQPLTQPLTGAALIFGPEDRGLNNDELAHAQRFVKIPTDDAYASLNLAQAVAVCCYELSRLNQQSQGLHPSEANLVTLRSPALSDKQTALVQQTASLEELDGYYLHLASVLLKIGYLYPHTVASRMLKFRQLLHRALPTSQEVALLRGMLRQVEWALEQTEHPPLSDCEPQTDI